MWKLYRHKKGELYLSFGRANHSESLESVEYYRCLYDNPTASHWVRPSEMFFDNVDGVPRFEHLGNIEVAAPEDMPEILMFGFDAWNEGRDRATFIKGYESCPNHLRGRRYVLRLPDGQLVAGLNTLRFTRNLCGIASVATSPNHRKQGHCNRLMKAVMALLEDFEGVDRLLLFSEPDPALYERLGFKILSDQHQHFLPSVAMLRASSELKSTEAGFLKTYF